MATAWHGALRRIWRRGGGQDGAAAAAFEPLVGEDEALPLELPPVRCPELGPFMRALHDAGVVSGDRGPNQSGMGTYWRLQHLAYLAAHNFGHPGLRYRYRTNSSGPYSLGLACDFYRFDTMSGSEPVNSSEWENLGAFLEFARNYRSPDWLRVAATLSHVNSRMLTGEVKCKANHNHSHRNCLVELTHVAACDLAREGIFRVYDSVKDILPTRLESGDTAQ